MTLSKCVSLHLHLKLIWFLNSHHFIVKFSPDSLPVQHIQSRPRLQPRLKGRRRWSCLAVLIISLSFCLFWAWDNFSVQNWKSGWCYLKLSFCTVSQLNVIFCHFLSESLEKEGRGNWLLCFSREMCVCVSFQLPDAYLDDLDRNSHANGIKVTQIKKTWKTYIIFNDASVYTTHIWTPKKETLWKNFRTSRLHVVLQTMSTVWSVLSFFALIIESAGFPFCTASQYTPCGFCISSFASCKRWKFSIMLFIFPITACSGICDGAIMWFCPLLCQIQFQDFQCKRWCKSWNDTFFNRRTHKVTIHTKLDGFSSRQNNIPPKKQLNQILKKSVESSKDELAWDWNSMWWRWALFVCCL